MKLKITKVKDNNYKVSTNIVYEDISDKKILLIHMLRSFKDLCNDIEQKLYEIENNIER